MRVDDFYAASKQAYSDREWQEARTCLRLFRGILPND